MQHRRRRQPAALKLRMPLAASSHVAAGGAAGSRTHLITPFPVYGFKIKVDRGKETIQKRIIGNNGQIKSLAGHNWPAGRLLPTPDLEDCVS